MRSTEPLDFDVSLFALPEIDTSVLHAKSEYHFGPAPVTPRTASEPIDLAHVWRVLDSVLDPEVPAVSIRELGIVRDVSANGERVDVVLTPTYSGCPATEMIEASVRRALGIAGYAHVSVSHRRAPAWTTDWITDEGRRKLLEYGIAPPSGAASHAAPKSRFGLPGSDGANDTAGVNDATSTTGGMDTLLPPIVERPIRLVSRRAMTPVTCPRCGSANTERLSAFGSTACKSLHRCRDCREPFEYFKPI
jgi:ring-1,2-phenylacetyl-CoA epoxidase subunit PaaD